MRQVGKHAVISSVIETLIFPPLWTECRLVEKKVPKLLVGCEFACALMFVYGLFYPLYTGCRAQWQSPVSHHHEKNNWCNTRINLFFTFIKLLILFQMSDD